MTTAPTYQIYTRVEARDNGYQAVAVAIAGNQPLRCAPPCRVARCSQADDAGALASRMAIQLAQELSRRGLKCVV
jgi:hypothetical protein